jgi:uncharacterized lipoprotein YddW (UPF0748 family)
LPALLTTATSNINALMERQNKPQMNTDKNRFEKKRVTNCGLQITLLFIVLCGFFTVVKAEVKAVWVRPFINADELVRKNPRTGREFIRKELERIKRAGLNTVYVEAFWDGYTIYPSEAAPKRPLEIPYGSAQSWDVLRDYIDEGAKLDLKIHAWIHVFHQWNTNLGGLEKSPIFSKHPDWAVLDLNGSPFVKAEAEGANKDIYKVFLSPANPEVRKYLQAVVFDLADRYPRLGGIQFDYIRYPLHTPDAPFDYNPATLAAFQKETGLDAKKLNAKKTPKEWRVWQDWKTRQVTEVVKELSETVRKRQPKWEISAAVFADIEENLRIKMQNWKDWSAKGYVDALCPMLYSRDVKKVERWAADFKRDVSPQTKIYPAFFIGHFYDTNNKTLNEDYLKIQEKNKFDGIAFFAAQSLTDDLIEKLAKKN